MSTDTPRVILAEFLAMAEEFPEKWQREIQHMRLLAKVLEGIDDQFAPAPDHLRRLGRLVEFKVLECYADHLTERMDSAPARDERDGYMAAAALLWDRLNSAMEGTDRTITVPM